MKKVIILSALVLGGLTANAQSVVEGAKFVDGWSVGINAGGVTPVKGNDFIKDARPAFGFGISKNFTPIFGMTLQGTGYVNTTYSKTAFDNSEVSLLGRANLMNLFGGYLGSPRVFEIETVAGIGWLHSFMNGKGDGNSWSTRLGLNFNFNLGETKAWTLALKPALVYDMQGDMYRGHGSRFNLENSFFELTAGLTYHFKTSNGTHHFAKVRAYDQAEVDRLNSSINALRSEVSSKDSELNSASQRINALQNELEACQAKLQAPVEKVVETNRIPESIVTFRQGRSSVDASQLPNVERVAVYMKKHQDAKVVIKGYASPEGSVEVNARIAAARAEAVKTILTRKYRIDASRITAEGQGVGDMFTEPDWNRVSICTIIEK